MGTKGKGTVSSSCAPPPLSSRDKESKQKVCHDKEQQERSQLEKPS